VLPVEGGQKATVSLDYPEEALENLLHYKLLRTGEEVVDYTIEIGKNRLQAPVSPGETVGELVVRIDGECIQKIPVLTAEAVVPVDFKYYFNKVTDAFFSGKFLSFLTE